MMLWTCEKCGTEDIPCETGDAPKVWAWCETCDDYAAGDVAEAWISGQVDAAMDYMDNL